MIKAEFYRNRLGVLSGYRVTSHGDPIVCSAVSALAINCANSIETLCGGGARTEMSDKNAKLSLLLPDSGEGETDGMALLLLKSLELGLRSIGDSYPGQIEISYIDS